MSNTKIGLDPGTLYQWLASVQQIKGSNGFISVTVKN